MEAYPPESSPHIKPHNKKRKLNKKCKLNLFLRKQISPETNNISLPTKYY
jgi:hypothetical protein